MVRNKESKTVFQVFEISKIPISLQPTSLRSRQLELHPPRTSTLQIRNARRVEDFTERSDSDTYGDERFTVTLMEAIVVDRVGATDPEEPFTIDEVAGARINSK
ncbi:hypothetical protein EVAR_33511_1 [Eumeta japonica]|uniref:Uncharacterized protein n=1 Tax=Eumeta variegata TaxID=151549 RepID=A0A4C1VJK6_EUMVA|nr:hypothetical protein EVAR_33511_1 [Eumeta japonica]